jgi:hypothetical protein
MIRFAVKILIFLALLAVFYAIGGFVPPHSDHSPIFSKQNPMVPWLLIGLLYIVGDGVAVWGDKVVGYIHPVSFRSGYVVFGVLLILAAALLASCERVADNRRTGVRPESNLQGSHIFCEAMFSPAGLSN